MRGSPSVLKRNSRLFSWYICGCRSDEGSHQVLALRKGSHCAAMVAYECWRMTQVSSDARIRYWRSCFLLFFHPTLRERVDGMIAIHTAFQLLARGFRSSDGQRSSQSPMSLLHVQILRVGIGVGIVRAWVYYFEVARCYVSSCGRQIYRSSTVPLCSVAVFSESITEVLDAELFYINSRIERWSNGMRVTPPPLPVISSFIFESVCGASGGR